MRGKRRIGFFAILVSMLFALVGSGVAHAASWTPGPYRYDGEWTTCGSQYDGLVQVKARFDSDDSDPAKIRLNADYDIVVINQSATRIRVEAGGTIGQSSFLWYSLKNPTKAVSGYMHPDDVLHVPAFGTEVFSASNPDRWKRVDGVSDSDPSPHGTPMTWSTRNPALEATLDAQVYTGGAWHTCGRQILAELTWN